MICQRKTWQKLDYHLKKRNFKRRVELELIKCVNENTHINLPIDEKFREMEEF